MFKYIKFDLFLKSSFNEGAWGDNSNLEKRLPKQENWPDLSNLSPEKRKELEKISSKIIELQKELDIKNASVWVVWNRKEVLETRSKSEISFKELSETGAYEINERVIKLRAELWELQEQKDTLLRSIELTKVNKLDDKDVKKMQKISSKEFLWTPVNERLRFITKWNIEAKEVKEWWVKELDFTFTFDWKFNRELYIRTTAWQTLPENVRSVSSDWVDYKRIWLNWEFFSWDGKRLLIHEWTKIDITKFWNEEDLKQIQEASLKSVEEFKNTPTYDLALESTNKWYDPKFVTTLFWEKFAWTNEWKKVSIEELLTDIARLQDDFTEDFPNEKAILDDWKPSEKFAWYVINSLKTWQESKIFELYWYDIKSLKSSKRVNNPSLWWGPINLEKINIDWVSPDEIKSVLSKKEFNPWTKDAQMLFLAACQSANLPPDWCNKESLHRILSRESNWKVWRLNYTIKWENPESFKEKATSSTWNNPIWAKSTASWLWQLLLSNVDKFYPDWRNWIWDSLNEAVWMLRYIKDRYWNPDVAWEVYWKMWSYDHPEKWRQQKWFAEWY